MADETSETSETSETAEATETETAAEEFAGILDGEAEPLQEQLGQPGGGAPDSVTADEAALRSRNQRAWLASEGHILYNRHDVEVWERRCNALLAAINGRGIRIDMGTLQIGAMVAAVFELLQLKGLVTEHEAAAAKAKAAHDGLTQILLRVEAEADQRKEHQQAAAQRERQLAVAERPPIFVPGRDG